jgi:hypothetical protein
MLGTVSSRKSISGVSRVESSAGGFLRWSTYRLRLLLRCGVTGTLPRRPKFGAADPVGCVEPLYVVSGVCNPGEAHRAGVAESCLWVVRVWGRGWCQ